MIDFSSIDFEFFDDIGHLAVDVLGDPDEEISPIIDDDSDESVRYVWVCGKNELCIDYDGAYSFYVFLNGNIMLECDGGGVTSEEVDLIESFYKKRK